MIKNSVQSKLIKNMWYRSMEMPLNAMKVIVRKECFMK